MVGIIDLHAMNKSSSPKLALIVMPQQIGVNIFLYTVHNINAVTSYLVQNLAPLFMGVSLMSLGSIN